MMRYLTPSKIGLLALVALYIESVVPITATVPLLSFLIKHTMRKRGTSSEPQTWDAPGLATIEQFRIATIVHASHIPGRTLWDMFLKKIWAIDSFDALHLFFDSLEELLERTKDQLLVESESDCVRSTAEGRLSRTSPLGVFVRRAQIEFTRLPLHAGMFLWNSFITFREPTLTSWRKRNPTATKSNFDTLLIHDGYEKAGRILYGDLGLLPFNSKNAIASSDDIERILEFQIDEMQKTGLRVSSNIKRKLEEMLHAGLSSSNLSHYLKFLDAWKGGDYTSAFDSLHRYFDYSMHIQGRTFYQYALVNMAIMQADFGCYSEAVLAIQESITMARENKDMSCLNFCLSWLHHFSSTHFGETLGTQINSLGSADKEAFSFIKSKAKENGMWSLLSTTLLGEVGLALSSGESVALAFENVARSAYLNNVKNVSIAHGNQMMVESSLYSRLGLSYMQWSRAEIFLSCYAPGSLSEDTMKLLCLQAMALSRRGKYNQSLSLIDCVDVSALRTLRYLQTWTAYLALLKLQNAVYSDDRKASEHYFSKLTANSPKDQTVGFEVSLLRIEILIRSAQLPAAMDLVDQLSTQVGAGHMDSYARIKLMILRARIYDCSLNSLKGFSIAVRAASLAFKSRILDVLWEAVIALCRVLCSLKEFDAAVRMLKSIIPQILEIEDCQLVASSFSCLADAYMGMAGETKNAEMKRKEHMTKALEYLERALSEYSKLGHVAAQYELTAKRALIMHHNKDLILANDLASQYLAIKQQG